MLSFVSGEDWGILCQLSKSGNDDFLIFYSDYKLHSTLEMSQQMIDDEGCQLAKVFVNINNPTLPSVSPQEITAQYGVGIGNAIGNISLNNNLAQLIVKVHHCPDQLRTIAISWQGGQAARSSSCL